MQFSVLLDIFLFLTNVGFRFYQAAAAVGMLLDATNEFKHNQNIGLKLFIGWDCGSRGHKYTLTEVELEMTVSKEEKDQLKTFFLCFYDTWLVHISLKHKFLLTIITHHLVLRTLCVREEAGS